MTSDNLSILGLVLDASILVQVVMGVLILASVVSWTLIFTRGRYLSNQSKKLELFEKKFWSGIDLNKLYQELAPNLKNSTASEKIFVSGFREFVRLNQDKNLPASVVMEGVKRSLQIALFKQLNKLESSLPLLATIQSMSPYIGLFGTVWGIMHSFQALGKMQQATLSMVAPGISEALIATAMGLVAAIPAGIFYNRYINKVDNIKNRYKVFIEEFTGVLHRETHSRQHLKEEV